MNIKKQTGAAAIYFVLVAACILGMGALGVEGSRYITEKAHLGDTMESAAIAVAESDDIRDEKSFNESQAKEVASAWVNYLMPDNKEKSFHVSREKKVFEKIVSGQKVTRTIHHYKLDGTTTHDSWMAMSGVPSFEKQQKVFNKATAARVRTDFEPVDVVFVSDFSGSMAGSRIKNLRAAIKDVTDTIFTGTQDLKKKHPNEKINDSSFGFIPFSKRIVVEKGGSYYCSSMLQSNVSDNYYKPMVEPNFSNWSILSKHQRKNEMLDASYNYNQIDIFEKYLSYAKSGSGSWYMPLDCNRGRYTAWSNGRPFSVSCNAYYNNHISYWYTANNLQLTKDYVLSTPMLIGSYSKFNTKNYCQTTGSGRNKKPKFHNIDRVEFSDDKQIKAFNEQIARMTEGGGTDMYQGLLAAPGQFEGAINKNRFIFVLSDGDENTVSFENLVKNGLCKNIRKSMERNAKGESTKFEMFVIGLQFTPRDKAYKDCFNKHIYTVNDLSKLKDVIMELLSNTTSYNVERD